MRLVDRLPKWVIAVVIAVLGAALTPSVTFVLDNVLPKLKDTLLPPPPRQIVVHLADYAEPDDGVAKVVVQRPATNSDRFDEVATLRWQGASRIVFKPANENWYLFSAEAMHDGSLYRFEKSHEVKAAISELELPARSGSQNEVGWRVVGHPSAVKPSAVAQSSAQASDSASLADLRRFLDPPSDESMRWLPIALFEVGVTEGAGGVSNPRIEAYFSATTLGPHSDKLPWSGAFVSWVLARAGIIADGSGNARNASWLGFGSGLADGRRGALAVLQPVGHASSGHVGFLLERRADCVLLVSGNVRNSVSVDCFPLSSVRAYRWPSS